MTCNAWNHHPDCSCGWGGIFYPPSISSPWNDVDRLGKPNAICPVCRAPIFFYQSPSGGKVYFDELQPPWPKHPCTDNRTSARQVSAAAYAGAPSYPPGPLPRWRPLPCKAVREGNLCTELEVAASDEARFLYGMVDRKLLDAAAPFFIRFVSKGMYEISTLRVTEATPGEIRFIAYSHPDDLKEAQGPKTKAALHPIRPVAIPKKPATSHVHLWYDTTSLSNVPVTYLNRGKKAEAAKSASLKTTAQKGRTLATAAKKRTKKS